MESLACGTRAPHAFFGGHVTVLRWGKIFDKILRFTATTRPQLRANGFIFPLHLNNIGECRRNWIHPATNSTEQPALATVASYQAFDVIFIYIIIILIIICRQFKEFIVPGRARDRRYKTCSFFLFW